MGWGGKGYAATCLLSLARRSGCYAVTCSQDARRNHYPSTSSHTCVGLVAWSVEKEDACFCATSITSCCSLDHVLPQSLSEMFEKPDFWSSWNVLALYTGMVQKVGDLTANDIAFASAMWHTTRWSSLARPKSIKRYASVEHSCWTRSGATWSASYPSRSIAKTKLPGRVLKESTICVAPFTTRWPNANFMFLWWRCYATCGLGGGGGGALVTFLLMLRNSPLYAATARDKVRNMWWRCYATCGLGGDGVGHW